ncbi:GLPGLI family protein [Flavobacterium sp. FPG59]|jgi:GLPGLI family protein|uniref:GLPGLI family protein n=1 Tax=Flavobacterium sp. FPG59 TaxID=1929267 RepID=UPI000A3683DC|nr:GLPGLI family protein [Flavobacterium sp. FPG59]OUD29813.1 hypothetical protein FPG59_15545 [Flavobacterium sp. FPG59]
MKTINFILIFFYSSLLFSQKVEFNSKIEYEMNFLLKNYNAVLLYNTEKSVFTYSDLANDDEKTDDEGNINITVADTISHLVYNNIIEKKLYNYTCIFSPKKHEWVEESTPDFNWIKINGTKTINNLLCNKATCTFRGRNYTAWYSPEIKNDYGPWKFSGLPGLILEIYDSENEVHFLVKRISIPFDCSVVIKPNNTIPYDKVRLIQKEKTDEFIKKMESKQERGFSIKVKVNSQQQIERE